MIVIIDYGMGNLRSVQKGFEKVGFEARVSSDPEVIYQASKVVFPGVGAFGDAMLELEKRDLLDPIKDSIKNGKPFLGLCLGLQLLFTKSFEGGEYKGLGIFKGEVKRFSDKLKVPHMGWNTVKFKAQNSKCKIFDGVPDGSYFYFVHSYYAEPQDRPIVAGATDYGMEFVCAVCKDNIYGLQFHPEKSQELGLKILENFAKLC